MKMTQIGMCIMLLGLSVGCATRGRLADLKDCGRFSVGYGPGLSADVKLGMLGHPSVGAASYTKRIGHDDRLVSGQWDEEELVWPAACWLPVLLTLLSNHLEYVGVAATTSISRDRAVPIPYTDSDFRRSITNGAIVMVGYHRYQPPRAGLPDIGIVYQHRELFLLSYPLLNFKNTTDLQLGASLGIVSFRVGINPLEIVDFLLGYVGLDIAGDDPKDASPTPGGTVRR